MSSVAAEERSNPSWFRRGETGNPGGRPSIKWLREKLETVDPETGQTRLQDMADHLIEVATKWEIIQRGDSVPVASARDSVEACRLLWQALSLVRKPPPSDDEQLLKLAEHFRQVARDSVDLALKVLGDKIKEMPPQAIAEALQAFSVNPRGFLEAAEAHVGVDAPAMKELSSAVHGAGNESQAEDQASPKGCDTASHAPEAEATPQHHGSAAPIDEQLEPQADTKGEGET